MSGEEGSDSGDIFNFFLKFQTLRKVERKNGIVISYMPFST